jgi:S-disulfanyl-L-cysteine oxidoreductase SoxD
VTNRLAYFASSLLAACGVAGILCGETPKTVLDGVYTEAQAARGQAAYQRSCSRCHGAELDGGGQARPLHTNLFLDVWREDYLSSLFQYMQTRMPPGSAENSLPEGDYVDILAYVLQVNKLPPGKQELTRQTIETTLLVGPDGPGALPPSATVRVVGCFTHPSADAWRLTRATSAARVRNGVETDEKELKLSAHAAPGTHSYRLENLDDDHPVAELQTQAGHKVQAKGVLNGQGDTARIYVLSFQGLGQPCDP